MEEFEIESEEVQQKLLADLAWKTKLTRDCIVKQALFLVNGYVKARVITGVEKGDSVKVGVIGAGMMGKVFMGLLNGRKIEGKRVEVVVSTRVPERF